MGPSSGSPRSEPEQEPAVDSDLRADAAEASDPTGESMSTAHLARFEFSDAGTKILMVEWLPGLAAAASDADDAGTSATQLQEPELQSMVASAPPSAKPKVSVSDTASCQIASENEPTDATPNSVRVGHVSGANPVAWEVSWPGKSTVLPASDADLDSHSEAPETRRRRVFFLLPPDAPVPPTVTIKPPGRAPIELKPLPAIFPDGFGDGEGSKPGSRGVLHTIWAKKRLRELEREMDAEMRANSESVGLEMALAEKQWIIESFLRPPPLNIKTNVTSGHGLVTPITPRSPTGRLGEKLKGLRLATSPADLTPSPTANTFIGAGSQTHTLSPTEGDMAVSSFSSITRPPVPGAGPTPIISLNAALHDQPLGPPITDDDELFALPISPRSPDMKKSPFSTLK